MICFEFHAQITSLLQTLSVGKASISLGENTYLSFCLLVKIPLQFASRPSQSRSKPRVAKSTNAASKRERSDGKDSASVGGFARYTGGSSGGGKKSITVRSITVNLHLSLFGVERVALLNAEEKPSSWTRCGGIPLRSAFGSVIKHLREINAVASLDLNARHFPSRCKRRPWLPNSVPVILIAG